jgi:hypothetical protein
MSKLNIFGVVLGSAMAILAGLAVACWPTYRLEHFSGQRTETTACTLKESHQTDTVPAPTTSDQTTDRITLEKERIANRLIDHHITLLQAAEQFRRLDQDLPATSLAPLSPSKSEDECLCREVLARARRRLEECYPGGVNELIAPFEEEFRRFKENGRARPLRLSGSIRITFTTCDPPER